MKRRFKTKNKKNKKFILLIILGILTFYFSYKFIFLYLMKNYIKEEDLITYLTSNTNNSIKNPNNLINYSLSNMVSEYINEEKEEVVTTLVDVKPLIYLYNTHQDEKYSKEYLELYNITPTVLTASYILEENLNNYGLPTITEQKSINSILKNKNLLYKDSYIASRYLLEDAKFNYPSLKYFIDIHRDSSSKEKTTTNINGISYAKILFVIGKEHENYENNLEFVNIINNKIKTIDESLTRGIIIKEGMYVNGIYNQDFSNRTILIEVGGIDNNIEEVNNSLTILAKVLFETIGDNYE